MILEVERTLNAAATPANRTALTLEKPDPVMVTFVPAAPRWGLTEPIRGAAKGDAVACAATPKLAKPAAAASSMRPAGRLFVLICHPSRSCGARPAHSIRAMAPGNMTPSTPTRFTSTPPDRLRRIAGLLRPGGWLVAQEALRSSAPLSHPHLEALSGYWNLVYEVLDRAGVPPGAIEDLPRSARQAGLDVAGMSGCFLTMDPEVGFELHAASLEAARERATSLGIAAGRVDDLARDIRAAKDDGYEWVSSGFVFDLILRKPVATSPRPQRVSAESRRGEAGRACSRRPGGTPGGNGLRPRSHCRRRCR